MSAVTAVEVEAAGMAATSIVVHRAIQDHLLDVGVTMTTIADLLCAEPIRMFQAKPETATDHLPDVDLLHPAARPRRRQDESAAIRLQKIREVHHGGEGAIAAATTALVHANVTTIAKTAATEMMRSDADRLLLIVDVAHHRLGATAADLRQHEAARLQRSAIAKHHPHQIVLRHRTQTPRLHLQSRSHLARKAAPLLQTI